MQGWAESHVLGWGGRAARPQLQMETEWGMESEVPGCIARRPHNGGWGTQPWYSRGGNGPREVRACLASQQGMMAARGLLLHHPLPGLPCWPQPHKGEGLTEKEPSALGHKQGRRGGGAGPSPPRVTLQGGAGGRDDKGADVGDASAPIMEDGPTHTADLG